MTHEQKVRLNELHARSDSGEEWEEDSELFLEYETLIQLSLED